MNQNEVNGRQQNSNMAQVAPPVVAPPIVKPPVVKPPVVPSVAKPPVVKPPIVEPPMPKAENNIETLENNEQQTKSENVVANINNEQQTIQENNLKTIQNNQPGSIIEKKEVPVQENISTIQTNLNTNMTFGVNDLVNKESTAPKTNEENNNSEVNTEKKEEPTIDDDIIIKKYMKKMKRRKIIKIACLLLLIVGAIFFVINFINFEKPKKVNKNKEHISVVYNKNNYIAVKGKNGYGYINPKGKLVIPHQYKYAYDFYGNYAIVEVDADTPVYNVIDVKGNVIHTTPFMPFYHADFGVWEIENKLYNDKLKMISMSNQSVIYLSSGYFYFQNHETKEYGILNSKGKRIIEFSNEQNELQISNNEFDEKEIYAITRDENNNINIINIFDSNIVLSKSSEEFEVTHVDNNIFKVLNKNENKNTWLYIKNNEVVYQTEEDLNSLNVYDYKNEILVADSKYGKYFYNIKTEETTNEPSAKSNASYFGYNIVTENNLMGLEKDGKIILDAKYTSIKFLDESIFNYIKNDRDKEFVLATDYGKTYLIDVNNNKTISTFNSINYILFKNTTFLRLDVLDITGNLDYYLIYNLMTGQKLEVQLDTVINYGANYISINDGKKIKYYNNEFEKIYEERL